MPRADMVTNRSDTSKVTDRTPRLMELEVKRQLCRDLMGGTVAMRKAANLWLPKFPAESQGVYDTRLNSNILTNFLEQAIDKATSKIFSQPIKLDEELNADIGKYCGDIDCEGRTLDSFMMDRAKWAFGDGVSYIFVDSPKVEGMQTVADEKKLEWRPYAVALNAEQILEITSETRMGKKVLTRIRFKEIVSIPNGMWGFKDELHVRVYVLEDSGKVSYQVWKELAEKRALSQMALADSGITNWDEIPFVAVYANRTGFMEGEPVFQATAELNLRHWRSMSEQIHGLTFGRFAMLSAVGVDTDQTIEVGASKILKASNPQARFGYVESNGVGLDQGWKDLDSIEASIQTASAKLRIESAGKVTATAAALESEETNAGLKAAALGMEESVEQMFNLFAMMMGIEEEVGGVSFNTNFGLRKGTDLGLQEVDKLVVANIISKKAAIQNLIWRGELPPDFDMEENDDEIQTDMDEALAHMEDVTEVQMAASANASEGENAIKGNGGGDEGKGVGRKPQKKVKTGAAANMGTPQ